MRWSGAAGRRGGGRVCVLLRSGGGCWHRKESVLGRQRRLRQAANSAGESRLLLAGAQTPRSGACGRLARPPPMPRTPQRCLELQEDGTTRHNLPCQAGLGPCPTLPFQKGTLCFDSPPTPPRPGGRCCVFEAFFLKCGLLVSLCWHEQLGRAEGRPICWWQSCLIAVRDRHRPPYPRLSVLGRPGPLLCWPRGPQPSAGAWPVPAGAPLAFVAPRVPERAWGLRLVLPGDSSQPAALPSSRCQLPALK